ncbi:TetR/AcrR family transcriptional regulator [Spiractinospora alimapuensis]|uniref:TetR/AcrR family transcriptional regulator n=1 Tax=Spiractinospora alimapuensis TaxID=2820884 RepID=UPI001F16B809|nr:TetR/AcrR family transcriptional regulator [Spiractinospora alimapuensis]QVQ53817.1 TetR/AcrR family transcriptional regulator [Spiractinospora alimapuensis]
MAEVKGRQKRTEKARQTRRRVVRAAEEMFVADGYGVTTLQGIAQRAEVAVQTIYFTFGNKRALLKEVVDTAIAGDDEPVATMDREWFRGAIAASTAHEHLWLHVEGTTAVLGRVARIVEMLRVATAVDPDVEGLWDTPGDPRYEVQRATAEALLGKPGIRPDLSAADVADVLYGLLSPELFLMFTREREWSAPRWQEWVYDTLVRQVCVDHAKAGE